MSARWIKVHCSIWRDPDFDDGQPMTQREAFLWMVSEATWKNTKVRRGDFVVELQRGQLAHSVRFMASAWGWSKSAGHRFLKKLEKRDSIRTESGTGVTLVTIRKYDLYQDKQETAGTGEGHEAGQVRDSSGTNSRTLRINRFVVLDAGELARRLAEVSGPGLADPAKTSGTAQLSEPMSWIKSGADFELDILPTIAALTAEPRSSPIRSWSYFRTPVMNAKAARETTHATPEAPNDKFTRPKTEQAANRDRLKNAWVDALGSPGDGGGEGDGSGCTGDHEDIRTAANQ